MITSSTYLTNSEEITNAEKYSLEAEEQYGFTEFGFSLGDTIYYKVFEEDGLIQIKFRNGHIEDIMLKEDVLDNLRNYFIKK